MESTIGKLIYKKNKQHKTEKLLNQIISQKNI